MNARKTLFFGLLFLGWSLPSLAQTADLSITKTATVPANLVMGDAVTFFVTVHNDGPDNATNVAVTDTFEPPLGSGFERVMVVSSGVTQGTYNETTGLWDVGTLNNGAAATLTITVEVIDTFPFRNLAEVTASDQGDPDSTPGDGVGDDAATTDFFQATQSDVRVEKVVDNPTPNVGDDVVFTIEVFASGDGFPGSATFADVLIQDLLPGGMTLVNAEAFLITNAPGGPITTPLPGAYDPVTGQVTFENLTSGSAGTPIARFGRLVLTVNITTPGLNQNCALVLSSVISGTSKGLPDPDPANNSACAVLNTNGSSGGGGAGVESQATEDLAVVYARRLFQNTKAEAEQLAKRAEAQTALTTAFETNTSGVDGAGSLMDVIDTIIPETGPGSTTGFVSTPQDLLGITNATSVFAADYLAEDGRRLAALFAASSPAGTRYDHAKVICDRFAGGVYAAVTHTEVQGHPFILSELHQPDGTVDFAIEFAVYPNQGRFEIENRFSWGEYTPRGDGEVLNFQVWAAVPAYTRALVSDILDQLSVYAPVDYQEKGAALPDVYVRTGRYAQGALHVEVANPGGTSVATFAGTYATTETGTEVHPFEQTVALDPNAATTTLTLPMPALFSATFELHTTPEAARDRLYHADGTWSYAHSLNARVHTFAVLPQAAALPQGHVLEREARITGELGANDWASLFRYVQPDGAPMDLQTYNTLAFEAAGSGTFHVELHKASMTNGDHYGTTITLGETPQRFEIPFADLAQENGTTGRFTAEDVTLIAFFPETTGAFDLSVRNVHLTSSTVLPNADGTVPQTLTLSQNYPNPFNPETHIDFALPEAGPVRLAVYDVLGREVAVLVDQHVQAGLHRMRFSAESLPTGVYIYRLSTPQNTLTRKMTLLR